MCVYSSSVQFAPLNASLLDINTYNLQNILFGERVFLFGQSTAMARFLVSSLLLLLPARHRIDGLKRMCFRSLSLSGSASALASCTAAGSVLSMSVRRFQCRATRATRRCIHACVTSNFMQRAHSIFWCAPSIRTAAVVRPFGHRQT